MSQGSDRLAVFAGLYAGVFFGVFWIPIRLIEQAGFTAPWALVVFTLIPALLCTPLIWRHRADLRQGFGALTGGILAGFAYALYSAALLYTDVVRAVLLFYLLPVWGFLIAWIYLNDPITRSRCLAVLLGIGGMLVVFADESGLPLPRNLGDWCGLVSGIFWAVGCALILNERRVHYVTHTASFFVIAAIISVVAALLATLQGVVPSPNVAALPGVMWWFVPLALVLILPTGLATIYAPSRLNPGVVGLLFMVEIVVAATTAAIWAGEPFGWREMVGLPLILMAGLVEPFANSLRRRRQSV